ncbi:MAG TPA: hypothetical protein VIP78_03375 [Candidatus Dormibacteraeota bacterium]
MRQPVGVGAAGAGVAFGAKHCVAFTAEPWVAFTAKPCVAFTVTCIGRFGDDRVRRQG